MRNRPVVSRPRKIASRRSGALGRFLWDWWTTLNSRTAVMPTQNKLKLRSNFSNLQYVCIHSTVYTWNSELQFVRDECQVYDCNARIEYMQHVKKIEIFVKYIHYMYIQWLLYSFFSLGYKINRFSLCGFIQPSKLTSPRCCGSELGSNVSKMPPRIKGGVLRAESQFLSVPDTRVQ